MRAGCLPVAILSAAIAVQPAPSRAEGLQPGLLSSDPIWTDRPVRIDRRKQAYEIVPVERKVPPLTLKPSSRVEVFDSASFRDGGRLYLLTDAIPANPKQLCRTADGRVAACGQQARLFLKRLITNRMLSCREDFRQGTAVFLTCGLAGADLAETLVAKGAAFAATPRLRAAQQEAIRQAAGLWTDADCRARQRCAPQRRR